MDDRVLELQKDFPSIFENRVKSLSDLDNDWVIIDVSGNESNTDELSGHDDEILSDLDRYDSDLEKPEFSDSSDRSTNPLGLLDIYLPPDIELERGDLIEIIRRRRPGAIDKIRRKITGYFPGGPRRPGPANEIVPPPDALAIYLPFHRYPDMWGIYLLDAGVESLAKFLQGLARLLQVSVSIGDARTAAVTYLFHHEAYHSAVEAFGLRCELPLRKPVYRTGLRKLYTREWRPGSPHEETLATAYGIRKTRDNLHLPEIELDAVVKALRVYMMLCSPPYAEGVNHLDDEKFEELQRKFMEEAIRNSTPRALPASAWTLGTYLMTPLLQRNRKYSWICDRADFRKRSKLAVNYFRQRDVIACLQRLAGATLEAGGRHQHLVRQVEVDGIMVPRRTQVPSGEVHKGTLGGMLKDLELDLNVHTFRDECRKVGKALS